MRPGVEIPMDCEIRRSQERLKTMHMIIFVLRKDPRRTRYKSSPALCGSGIKSIKIGGILHTLIPDNLHQQLGITARSQPWRDGQIISFGDVIVISQWKEN
jgi:hypothetical protein